jgi:putative transcriptional regulator
MAKTQFKSELDEAIHGAASGLYRAKVIGKKTMREYDDLCIEAAPDFDPKEIARIREAVHVSQGVFAAYLNTSASTIQQWERGDRKPNGVAARLLQLVQKHGLALFA